MSVLSLVELSFFWDSEVSNQRWPQTNTDRLEKPRGWYELWDKFVGRLTSLSRELLQFYSVNKQSVVMATRDLFYTLLP